MQTLHRSNASPITNAWGCSGINEQKHPQIAWAADTYYLTLGSHSRQATCPRFTLTNATGVSTRAQWTGVCACVQICVQKKKNNPKTPSLQRLVAHGLSLNEKLSGMSWSFSITEAHKKNLSDSFNTFLLHIPINARMPGGVCHHCLLCFCQAGNQKCVVPCYRGRGKNFLKPEDPVPQRHAQTFCSYQLTPVPCNPAHHHREHTTSAASDTNYCLITGVYRLLSQDRHTDKCTLKADGRQGGW